jgi:hypothetical protein
MRRRRKRRRRIESIITILTPHLTVNFTIRSLFSLRK